MSSDVRFLRDSFAVEALKNLAFREYAVAHVVWNQMHLVVFDDPDHYLALGWDAELSGSFNSGIWIRGLHDGGSKKFAVCE